jgi:DNA-binding MarR family transcriptional regulator
MTKGNVASLISHIRDSVNRFIIEELVSHGIQGIVPSHGDILMYLYHHNHVTMKELAEHIHRSKPTVTILVNKLVDHGYVIKEKDANDKRATYIKLTQKGKELQPIFKAISARLKELMYGSFSEEEGMKLENLLENLLGRF